MTTKAPAVLDRVRVVQKAKSSSVSAKAPAVEGRAPELALFVGNAFNAKSGNFLGHPVFNLTYTDPNGGNQVDWGSPGRVVVLPDQITGSMTTELVDVARTTVMHDKSDYDMRYSLSMNAEYTGVSFSGSASSKYMYHGTLFEQTDATYTLNFHGQRIFQFQRAPVDASALTSIFVTHLEALPEVLDETAYFHFFDKFGTHYVHIGAMGGSIIMQTTLYDTAYKSMTDTEMSAHVNVGWNGIVSSAKLDVEAAYQASKTLEKNRASTSISLDVVGGLFVQGGSFSDWTTSLYETPSILLNIPEMPSWQTLTALEPISNLARFANVSPIIEKNLIAMIQAYMASVDLKDGVFTSSRVRDPDEQIRHVADGLFYGYLQSRTTNDISQFSVTNALGDSPNGPPVVAMASQHFYPNSDQWTPQAAFMIPVQKGSSSIASLNVTYGSPLAGLHVTSFGDTSEPTLGDWEQLTAGGTWTATSDGFVIATVGTNQGEWGAIVGSILENGSFSPKCFAGADLRANGNTYVPANSFCMPVQKGAVYQVAASDDAPVSNITVYFVPIISPYLTLGEYQLKNLIIAYTPSTPGFVIASINADADWGARAEVAVFTSDDIELVKAKDPVRALKCRASAHTWKDDIVAGCSATVPVPQGYVYGCYMTVTSPTPSPAVWWVPLYVNQNVQSPSSPRRRVVD